MVRQEFARFSDEKVHPTAEEIHRHDQLIPEALLSSMGELGIFGISIPDKYGGSYMDHGTMIIATEELSRASLGAGGSVITRPEICAKAILKGGTAEQKEYWLPLIASGEKIICVAVTEPDVGSDVANVKLSARQTQGGWLLNGEKTWCTFAGRADILCVLARTGAIDEGHKGLTLFLAEKPGIPAGQGNEYAFKHVQSGGGTIEGNAIPTVGYRGMHSFSVSFGDFFVPDENRIGEVGQGFYLQMEGFSGGRIQTAARAVGVMEAAFREAIGYVQDRRVFGQSLGEFSLTQVKLAQMAARIQAGRQLAYHVGSLMDRGRGGLEASLVKFMTCKDAEWVTRESMQLHGGMGYSEEYPISRYWLDARVLSIFEGAEEVLALLVIARQYLARFIA
jgi:(2S)-methylsuccinyl-CoA dehydrogenase